MPQEVFVDTSVWAALAQHDLRAQGLGDRLGERQGVISSLAWAELASLAERGQVSFGKVEAVAQDGRVEGVLHEDCVVGGQLHGRLRRRGHPKVSLIDCIIYASARRLGVDLITLDTDLEGLPGVEVLGKKG